MCCARDGEREGEVDTERGKSLFTIILGISFCHQAVARFLFSSQKSEKIKNKHFKMLPFPFSLFLKHFLSLTLSKTQSGFQSPN